MVPLILHTSAWFSHESSQASGTAPEFALIARRMTRLKIERKISKNKSNENMLITKASNDWYVHGVYKLGKKEEENSYERPPGPPPVDR